MSQTSTEKYSSGEVLYQGHAADSPDKSYAENPMPEDAEKKSFLQTVQSKLLSFGTHLSGLKLEMVAFLFTFSYVMTQITSTTMIIDKVCRVNFGYPSYICSDLENHTTIKSSVEKLATNYQLVHTLIQTAPAALLACFILPWSDHYGRKFPILLAIFGMSLDAIGSAIYAYFLQSRVEYYFIPAIFTGIFGGPVSILALMYSYVSDSTPPITRTIKYGLLEMATGFSMPAGKTAGGWIYHFIDYSAVFLFSAGGLFLSFISVMFLLKETRGLDNDDSWSIKMRMLFSVSSFKESFIAVSKQRPHQGRKQILLLIFSICFLVISLRSTGDIDYFFVHHQFGWDNPTYSTITSIYSVFAIVILIFVFPLLKRYRVGDPILGLIGIVSQAVKQIGMGLAWKKEVYHVANVLGVLGGVCTFAARSRISKVVSDEDLGKIFSFVASAESLLPVLASVLVSQLFNAFLGPFPGIPYIVLALFLIPPLAVFSWMTRLPKMTYEDPNNIAQNS